MRLRGHHLVCLHFFRGEGYSPEFVQGLAGLIRRAEAGEPVVVACGPDDVCSACPYLAGERCAHTEASEAEVREMDEAALGLLGLSCGQEVSWAGVRDRLPGVLPEWRGRYCVSCQWACPEVRSRTG